MSCICLTLYKSYPFLSKIILYKMESNLETCLTWCQIHVDSVLGRHRQKKDKSKANSSYRISIELKNVETDTAYVAFLGSIIPEILFDKILIFSAFEYLCVHSLAIIISHLKCFLKLERWNNSSEHIFLL